LRQSVRIGLGAAPLRRAIDASPEKQARIIAYRLTEPRTKMTATVQGIKELAEATSEPRSARPRGSAARRRPRTPLDGT
jgi:hypothetical protein